MDIVVGPQRRRIDYIENAHVGQRPGKVLLAYMRMVQRPRAYHRAVRWNHIPFIYIIAPAPIDVFGLHMKRIGPRTAVMCSTLMTSASPASAIPPASAIMISAVTPLRVPCSHLASSAAA